MSYVGETLSNLLHQTAFFNLTWGNYVMILVAFIFLYLAIKKGFEPLLLVPIAFGMLLVNIYPDIIASPEQTSNGVGGLLYYFYTLDEWSILPSLIFMGVGAMTDFGPLIANPVSFLMGAAAQFGIFSAYFLAIILGFNDKAAAAVSIIGGADGPTSIFLAGKLGQTGLMGPIAVAAYSYGTCADHSATYHEVIYNKEGTCDQDAEPSSGQQAGEDPLPNRCYRCCLRTASYHSTTCWYADAWKPLP